MAPVEAQGQGTRRKFAKPPVKLACLACRASRVRCDGKETCTTCLEKGKKCCYTKSNRGGPRYANKNGKQKKGSEVNSGPEPLILTFEDQMIQNNWLATPGAGLRHLDRFEPTDVNITFPDNVLFDYNQFNEDDIFNQDPQLDDMSYGGVFDNQYDTSESRNDSTQSSPPETFQADVRTYGSDVDILDAYYIYIHPYFPILPPPLQFPARDRPATGNVVSSYEPSTPITLALSAILALIPLTQDEEELKSETSIWKRRSVAHGYAQAALQSIDADSELLESSISPPQALQNYPHSLPRPTLHPETPSYLESIYALLLLGNYEYTQRGNLAKMRSRAGQALNLAMDMRLYADEKEGEIYIEARRRAWWMTYITVCQSAVISNMLPNLDILDPRFKIPYPTNAADPGAWSFFVQGQHALVEATSFGIDFSECLANKSDMTEIYLRNKKLDDVIGPLQASAEVWTEKFASNMPVDAEELAVAKCLRTIGRIKLNSSRIKLHRYSAFLDIPIFSQKHCDIEPTGPLPTESSNLNSETNFPTTEDSTSILSSSYPLPLQTVTLHPQAPFSSSESARICHNSALNVALSFATLPYPNPNPGSFSVSPSHRTMVSFACSAMQASYALLMLCYKAAAGSDSVPVSAGLQDNSFNTASYSVNSTGYATYPPASNISSDPVKTEMMDLMVRDYVDRLRQGLQLILQALENYSNSFEAIDGMREQIEQALAVEMLNL